MVEPLGKGDIAAGCVAGRVLLLEGEFALVVVVADEFNPALDGDELATLRLIFLLALEEKLLTGCRFYFSAVEELG